MSFPIVLDRNSPAPLRRQLYNEWRKAILTGRIRPGQQVPSTRELAATLGISRSTVAEAWEQLAAEGYFTGARGSGTYVSRELPDASLTPRSKTRVTPQHRVRVKLSRFGASLSDDFTSQPAPPGVINFAPGLPDRARFPFELWRRLLARHLRHAASAVFDYAENAAGEQRLREEIAAYVGRLRAVRCTAEQVVIVNGTQQALDLCARLLLDPGDQVAFENPGYRGARLAFAAQGARLAPVAIDAEGIAIGRFRRNARLVYVTPSHQFPTGISMSLKRRLELIEWARRRNAVIVEDDYCSEYRYHGAPLPSLQGLAENAPVIYVGTFSKILFPGLRIGYVIAPPDLAPRFARAKWLADRHTAVLEQRALADFLSEGHLERHVRRMRRLYGARREALVDALHRHFGDRAQVSGAAAGMHALVGFNGELNIARRAQARGVQLTSATAYYLGSAPGNEFLMGFSSLGEQAIREGVKRLARA